MRYRKLTFWIFFFGIYHSSFAQAVLTGIVADKEEKTPLAGASVVLEDVVANKKVFAITDNLGKFKIENLTSGEYYLKISYVGYQNHESYIAIKHKPADIGTVYLSPASRQLKEVVVEGTLPRVEIKGDTTVFNADAYKTMPDASAEDLVKKLPGVVVNNGKVQAEGEDVRQVRVDGKPFFGEDPNIALRNLPAEIIDQIQIYDEKSEQSRFTGFDDGNTKKTMNIVTRPGMRKSRFGKIYGGYGYENNDDYDSKYSLGGNLNIFNGDQRVSVLAQTNNINVQNFSLEDIVGAISGGGGRIRIMAPPGGMRRPSNDSGFRPPGFSALDNFLVQDQGGISSTDAVGINYSDTWGKKIDVTGSYFFNHSNNTADETLRQEYTLDADSGYVYREDQYAANENTNHRLNFQLDYRMDDNNSILLKPRFTFQENNSASVLYGDSYRNGTLLNSAERDYRSSILGYNFSNQLLFRHKFAKSGRTLSLDLNVQKNQNTGDSELHADGGTGEGQMSQDDIDQSSDTEVKGYTLSSNLSYTEPVSINSQLQFSYYAAVVNNESEKNTFNYDAFTGEYALRDTSLSNIFESRNIIHKGGVGYRFRTESSYFTVGADYQTSHLYNTGIFPQSLERDYLFTDILPNAMFRTRFSEKNDLMVMYRTSTANPSVNQLQDVIENSNPLQLSIGNPELEQQYFHRFMARFGSVNRENAKIFFAAFGGGVTANYISNSTFISGTDTLIAGNIVLPAGGQLIKPVNLNGSWNMHSFLTYGFPVKEISSNLNLNLSANYSHIPAMINFVKSHTENTTLGAGLVLSSNIAENLDFTLSGNNSFSSARNSLRENLNDQYYNFSGRFDLSWQFLKKLIFRTDINYENYQGLAETYDQQYMLWNVSIGTKFMEENRGEISIKVYDLLDQNSNVQRNVTATYIEDLQTKVLQRYFMISLTYNFMKGTSENQRPGKRMRFIGPPDIEH